MHSIDIFVQNYFSLARTAPFTQFMILTTKLFDVSIHLVLLIFLIAILVCFTKGFSHAVLFVLALAMGAVSGEVLKILFNVSRPLGGVIIESGKSFPSLHAIIASVFFIMLMYIFDDYFSRPSRIVFNIICTTLIFLVALSRVYLGVHWVSDVIFGVFLGSLVSYLSLKFFKNVTNIHKNTFVIE